MNKPPESVRSTTHRLKLLFLSLGMVVVAGIVLTFLVGHTVITARDMVQERDIVLEQLQKTFSMMQDAETGQRGYLLTLDRRYLQPYNDSRADIRKQMEVLQTQVESGNLSASDVSELNLLVMEKLEELQATIDLAESNNAPRALERMKQGEGKRLMDSLREKFGQLQLQQQRERARAEDEASAATTYRTSMFVVIAGLNLLFLAWAYIRIRREMSFQYVAALETERQREILSVSLASIGDAVMITDTNGIITFLNQVAEDLTGWTATDAVGKPCARVFRIINETSRAPVDSPVDKVMEKGVIVGLANHTLLIRRDGSEVPIDDSGAPIREKDGTMRGVVLVFRDFSAHKEAEHKLIKAKDDVEAASKAKDNFLATLSHELRTPLTPVLATLSTWEANRSLPGALQPELQLVRRNVEMEARLIDDLLDLTRIEHGKLMLDVETVNAHDLIEAVVALYSNEAQAKQVQLTPALRAGNAHVVADPSRLQQVFWNIVGNAVKFTPTGGHISIVTRNQPDGELEIIISDDGIGMSQDIMERLFHRFEQGSTTPHKSRGLGLGLSIAKALVSAHHGTLRASSQGEHHGSVFTITLPVTEPPAPDTRPVLDATQPQAGKALQILLLEDHADTAQVMSAVLRGMGHEVELAGTVAAGVEKIHARKFDLILSDLGLPDGTGLNFIEEARKVCETPAIALTGYGMAEDVEKCLQAGFDEHLTKPIDFERLQKSIGNATRDKGNSPS